MFSFITGNKIYKKISFDDVQYILRYPEQYIIINTLREQDQACLIKNTISSMNEEEIINELILNTDYKSKHIVIYGTNQNDEKSYDKCQQLINFGFCYVYLYPGGIFEWLLLQDIYGKAEFPTTSQTLDILKYKPSRAINPF
jgi:hypothetical protein|tara:strand:+ start:597 stop:1022 length:426 start_codon:yes stop_codon:yes gene_type:complete